jgi:hypothetical protein
MKIEVEINDEEISSLVKDLIGKKVKASVKEIAEDGISELVDRQIGDALREFVSSYTSLSMGDRILMMCRQKIEDHLSGSMRGAAKEIAIYAAQRLFNETVERNGQKKLIGDYIIEAAERYFDQKDAGG